MTTSTDAATGQKALDVLEERFIVRCAVIGRLVRKGAVIQLRLAVLGLEDRFDLGRKKEAAILIMEVIQGLYPKSIPRDEQFTGVFVPNRECEHASQLVNAGFTPFFVKVQDGFGVAIRLVPVASLNDFGA